MKFKSITLHNFMRYKGDNTLLFSTDPVKNVTVVLGDNTFGKTTLAQAFRWGLYEEFNDTNYTKKKDIVILNNEVIAEMTMESYEDVYVAIVVENEENEWKFVRKATFNRKSENPYTLSVKQIGNSQLTMQIKQNGVWGDIINDDGNNLNKKYKLGCVQEAIENMFPRNLSNYFFFDGERWRDSKSKTEDIKDSIDTILGVSGLIEMKKHLKDNRVSVISLLRKQIKGSSDEYDRIQETISGINERVENLQRQLDETKSAIETTQHTYDSTSQILNDNRKVEDDQKEYDRIEKDIENNNKFKDDYYADIVREFSKSARYFAAGLLPQLNKILENIDLQGKDIPGVTIDTIDYLLDMEECLCGSKLTEGTAAYENILKLRKLVPPEMLGGAAGKLQSTLQDWKNETAELVSTVTRKADDYSSTFDRIIDLENDKERLERTMDRKTNLGPVRQQNQQAKLRLQQLENQRIRIELQIKAACENKRSAEDQLDQVAQHNKENDMIYRALAYAQAIYEKADRLVSGKQDTIITDLNEIIRDNFHRMFNDREKYAKLEDDYKIHVYYHKVGDLQNYEEENLSNGETIAINFVFIVSILELAKRYRELESQDDEYGMENAILGLPLVLDGPFSSLSNENTSLIADRLPEFAEQVIIFMLDKDWEASGLEKYTLPQFCYRVAKEATSNSSSIEKN